MACSSPTAESYYLRGREAREKNQPVEAMQAFIGPVRSGMWQAFAWMFGASLKKGYDPDGTDKLTERVVLMVEAGQL